MNTSLVTEATPNWPLPVRIGFRFVFSYLMLYLFNPTAQTLLHTIPEHLGFDESLRIFLAMHWAEPVRWLGERILGLSTPYEWTDRICCALLAFIVTVVWSWLDRRRPGSAVRLVLFIRGSWFRFSSVIGQGSLVHFAATQSASGTASTPSPSG